MVQIPDVINKTIQNYLLVLREHHIPIKKAVLFGSYASGKYQKWSDIDIALVSDIFHGDRIEDKNKIRSITLSVSSAIEVIPFSPQDFTCDNPFANEIIKTGITLI